MSKFDKLSDIGEVIDSLHKTPKYSDVGRAMVRCTDVKYGRLDLTNTFKVSEEVFAEFSRRYTPKKDDIIITRVGSYGITALVEDDDFCLGQNTSVIVPKAIDSRYLYLALNSFIVKNQIEFSVVGSTQKTLSLKAINNLDIPRFDIEVEKKIAKIVGQLDDKIELNRQNNQTLEHIAQALFKCWFVDFEPTRAKIIAKEKGANTAIQELAAQAIICGAITLEQLEAITQDLETTLQQAINEKLSQANQTPINTEQLKTTAALFPNALVDSDGVTNSSGTNLHERSEPEGGGSGTSRLIPEGWREGCIGDIAAAKGGYAFKGKSFVVEGNPVVKIKNITGDGRIDLNGAVCIDDTQAELSVRFKLEDGDLLMAMTGATVGKIGIVVTEGNSVYLNQRVAKFESNKFGANAAWFLYCCFKRESIFDLVVGAAQGSAQPNISSSGIESTKLLLPTDDLVVLFCNKVDALFKKWLATVNENSILEKQRDTLLPKLLSGELNVSND